MKNGKLIFTGNFIEFFALNLLLLFISFITFGILFPYYIYATVKYFINHIEIRIDS